MKPRADDDNVQLAGILDNLLASDVDITVREVARRHPSLRHASAFTRDTERMELIQRAQARQTHLRTTLNPHVVRALTLAEKLDVKSEHVMELEGQVRALVASHAACIQAVMVSGGMAALERFWKEYKAIGDSLRTVSAFPDSAEVVTLHRDKP
jgi:cell division protein ZapA (FtsZ GTPase activity inhibitor)